ncbi:MAG: fluoride efflux transporter CrcB [Proteobacteria bacterium]|nr:fluoride efflux transporter CrcB [Pseudomonadota bacterium]
MTAWLAVALGGALGALARWRVSLALNPLGSTALPLGTLAVNCVGGLLVGALVWRLTQHPSEGLRLLLVTGFLGGLTTFSTFSAESLALLQAGRPAAALLHTAAHVLGALACAALGAWLAAKGLG